MGAFEYGRDGVAGLAVGFDGSRASYDALAYAAGMARRGGARLVVAFVSTQGGLTDLSTAVAAAAVQSWEELANQLARDAARMLDDLGVEWEFVWLRGDVCRSLEKLVHDRKLDAIVVGRSASRLRHMLGAVPNRLVAHARCPVIVVP